MTEKDKTTMPAAPDWAPRVAKRKIAELYLKDAKGLVDEELIDEVGYAILFRCESIVEASEAARGRVACPQCRTVFRRPTTSDDALRCSQCAWQSTWTAYKKSYQHKQLSGGGAEPFFKGYIEQFPKARTGREKMVMIDTLIHRFHGELRKSPTRTAAVNLIEGKVTDVLAFLDDLTYGDHSAPGAKENLLAWREKAKNTVEYKRIKSQAE
ncbi:MAG: hypothetical protein GKR89_25680 [Candidatus Latescibacteria bacterium]|nr:hypothetical protein [Candidatus Latescibacterota bacterium]